MFYEFYSLNTKATSGKEVFLFGETTRLLTTDIFAPLKKTRLLYDVDRFPLSLLKEFTYLVIDFQLNSAENVIFAVRQVCAV